jgi:hypothetical protein
MLILPFFACQYLFKHEIPVPVKNCLFHYNGDENSCVNFPCNFSPAVPGDSLVDFSPAVPWDSMVDFSPAVPLDSRSYHKCAAHFQPCYILRIYFCRMDRNALDPYQVLFSANGVDDRGAFIG